MSGSGEPRLALTTEADWDDDTRALMEGSGGLNIFRALANHPKLLKRWLVFGSHVLAKSSLSERDRELAPAQAPFRTAESKQRSREEPAEAEADEEDRERGAQHVGARAEDVVERAQPDDLEAERRQPGSE